MPVIVPGRQGRSLDIRSGMSDDKDVEAVTIPVPSQDLHGSGVLHLQKLNIAGSGVVEGRTSETTCLDLLMAVGIPTAIVIDPVDDELPHGIKPSHRT